MPAYRFTTPRQGGTHPFMIKLFINIRKQNINRTILNSTHQRSNTRDENFWANICSLGTAPVVTSFSVMENMRFERVTTLSVHALVNREFDIVWSEWEDIWRGGMSLGLGLRFGEFFTNWKRVGQCQLNRWNGHFCHSRSELKSNNK